jgi:hypothetical protein
MKARVPPSAVVWRELGKGPAQEMAFVGVCPFSACWVITDGKRRWKYLHINRRKSGIYVAMGLKGGFHSSYHADGTRHLKMGRKTITMLKKGPPLEEVKGYVQIASSGSTIETKALRGYAKVKGVSADMIIYIDNRTYGPNVGASVYIVEPFAHGKIPLHTDQPSFFYLITHTVPWLAVVLTDQSRAKQTA